MHRHNLFTSNFKKTFVFFTKLIVLLGILIGFMLYLSPQYSQGYCAAVIDKVNRLKSIEGPKIVLIGDSNLAFGIKSEEIETAFDMPVVNMGFHGGVQNAFNEQMAKLNVQEGDIYIICNSSYTDGQIGADLVWITIEDHFELWQLLRREDIIPMVRAYPAYLKACINLWLNNAGNQIPVADGAYRRDAFNEYGDIVWDDSDVVYTIPEGSVGIAPVADWTIERLNKLNQYLYDRGATMLIAGYPIADCAYTPPKEQYDALQEELCLKLDAPVISNFRDYFYPESYFFNSALHLNTIGKEARTQQLICDLKNYFTSLENELDLR